MVLAAVVMSLLPRPTLFSMHLTGVCRSPLAEQDLDLRVVASAPGKVILFGEHAVVYGKTAVAVAVSDLRIVVTAVRQSVYIFRACFDAHADVLTRCVFGPNLTPTQGDL